MTDMEVVLLAMCPHFMLNMGWRKESKGGSRDSTCLGKWEMFLSDNTFQEGSPKFRGFGGLKWK